MTAEHGHGPEPRALEAALGLVRPLIVGHGGDVAIRDVRDGVVAVAFTGACQACPNLPMTYVGAVRTSLMNVPGVREVTSADVHAGPRTLARLAATLGARPFDPDS